MGGGVRSQASNRWAMADNDAPDTRRGSRPRGVRARLVCGLGQSLGGNATAFGYSVTIMASFGAVELGRGAPRFGDLIVFGLGAVVAFGGLEGVATGGFRSPLEKGSDDVILLGTALAFVSIVLAIAAARGLAAVSVAPGRGSAPRSVPRWCSRWSRAWSSCLPNGCKNAVANRLSLTSSPRRHPQPLVARPASEAEVQLAGAEATMRH